MNKKMYAFQYIVCYRIMKNKAHIHCLVFGSAMSLLYFFLLYNSKILSRLYYSPEKNKTYLSVLPTIIGLAMIIILSTCIILSISENI